MGSQVRWVQRWIIRAGLAGLFVVMCLLAALSLLTQDRVASSAQRANASCFGAFTPASSVLSLFTYWWCRSAMISR